MCSSLKITKLRSIWGGENSKGAKATEKTGTFVGLKELVKMRIF